MRAWPPPPELPPPSGHAELPLPRPDLDALERDDPPFARVHSERSSVREPGPDPLTAAQLGEFLFRVGRVEDLFGIGEGLIYAPRPYPAAGGLYEIELYVVVNACDGVERGLYHYRGDKHVLAALADANEDVESLLADATAGIAAERPPSVLVIFGVRFGRIAWKYGPLAYSLVLKNVGVVMQTMYLVATAMGLAPCAVGAGSSETFARATGLSRDEATSVGEFCLSSGS
jgi:SagB-type dehydrogenase family enzyme